MEYFVYLLKSVEEHWHYVGLTNNLERRLKQHNGLKVRSTKAHAPYKLIYYKSFKNRDDARDYEKFLKVRSNKEKLLKDLYY